MGYFSRLAVELLEQERDRELILDEDIEQPKTNQELAAEFQEAQYSLWNGQYRKELEENVSSSRKKEQPKVYQKKRPQ